MRNYNWKIFVLVLFLAFCFTILAGGSADCQFSFILPFPTFPAPILNTYNYSNFTNVSNYSPIFSSAYAYGGESDSSYTGMGSGYMIQYGAPYGLPQVSGYLSQYSTQGYGYMGMGSGYMSLGMSYGANEYWDRPYNHGWVQIEPPYPVYGFDISSTILIPITT